MCCLSHFTTIHSNVGIMLLIIIIAAAILCKYIVLYSQMNFDSYNLFQMLILDVLDDVKTASGMIVSNPAAFGNSWAAPTDFGTVRLFSELSLGCLYYYVFTYCMDNRTCIDSYLGALAFMHTLIYRTNALCTLSNKYSETTRTIHILCIIGLRHSCCTSVMRSEDETSFMCYGNVLL